MEGWGNIPLKENRYTKYHFFVKKYAHVILFLSFSILCITVFMKRYHHRPTLRTLQRPHKVRMDGLVVDDKSDDCRDSFRYPETVPYACRTKYLA